MRHVGFLIVVVLLSPLSAHGASGSDRSCKVIDVASGKIVNTCLQTAVYTRRVATTRVMDPFGSPHSWGWADQDRARSWGEPAVSNDTGICTTDKSCLNTGRGCGAPGVHQQVAYLKTWIRSMWCR